MSCFAVFFAMLCKKVHRSLQHSIEKLSNVISHIEFVEKVYQYGKHFIMFRNTSCTSPTFASTNHKLFFTFIPQECSVIPSLNLRQVKTLTFNERIQCWNSVSMECSYKRHQHKQFFNLFRNFSQHHKYFLSSLSTFKKIFSKKAHPQISSYSEGAKNQ